MRCVWGGGQEVRAGDRVQKQGDERPAPRQGSDDEEEEEEEEEEEGSVRVCAPQPCAIRTAAQQRTQHSAQRRTAAHPAGTCGRRARTCAARSCRRPSTRPGARSSPLGTRRRGSSRCPLTRTRRSLVCLVVWLCGCVVCGGSVGSCEKGRCLEKLLLLARGALRAKMGARTPVPAAFPPNTQQSINTTRQAHCGRRRRGRSTPCTCGRASSPRRASTASGPVRRRAPRRAPATRQTPGDVGREV